MGFKGSTFPDDTWILDPRKRCIIHADMLDSALEYITTNSSGAGATAAIDVSNFDANHPGELKAETGTTTTGWASCFTQLIPVGADSRFSACCKITTLSTVSEEFIVDIGFSNSSTGSAITDGYYFRYDRLTSANWLIRTVSDTASTTTTTSSTAVAAGSYLTFDIILNSDRTAVTFYLNGSSLGQITTNLPAANDDFRGVVRIIKSAGTTSRDVFVDYITLNYKVAR